MKMRCQGLEDHTDNVRRNVNHVNESRPFHLTSDESFQEARSTLLQNRKQRISVGLVGNGDD